MSKLEQIKALENGKGLQYLVDEACRILGNPINIFDTDYRLMVFSDVEADDPLWNELVKTGTFCRDSQIFFMNEAFTDEVANAKKLATMKSNKLKYDRILGHIVNGNGIKVANVLMLEINGPFDADMIAAFEQLTELITDEIRDDEYYIAYGEAYCDTWINRLIDDNIEERRLYSPHVQILYNGFKTHLYLAVADLEQSPDKGRGSKYFVDLLRQEQKGFKYAVYDGYIVMIISTNYRVFNKKRELYGLEHIFERENMLIGVSSCFDNLFELRQYYGEALEALGAAKRGVKGRVAVYDGNGN